MNEESAKFLCDAVKEMRDDIKVISTQTSKNTAILEIHMKRSDALEKHVGILEKRIDKELVPNKVFKILAGVFGLILTVAGVWKLFAELF